MSTWNLEERLHASLKMAVGRPRSFGGAVQLLDAHTVVLVHQPQPSAKYGYDGAGCAHEKKYFVHAREFVTAKVRNELL